MNEIELNILKMAGMKLLLRITFDVPKKVKIEYTDDMYAKPDILEEVISIDIIKMYQKESIKIDTKQSGSTTIIVDCIKSIEILD